MRVLDDLAGQFDVLFKGQVAAVDHDGGETAVDAALAQLEAVAMVQMDGDGQIEAGGLFRVLNGGLDELHQVDVLGVLAGTGGHLQDQGSLLLHRGLGDALDDLHVVDVESADGVAAVIGFLEHLSGSYDRHVTHSFS